MALTLVVVRSLHISFFSDDLVLAPRSPLLYVGRPFMNGTRTLKHFQGKILSRSTPEKVSHVVTSHGETYYNTFKFLGGAKSHRSFQSHRASFRGTFLHTPCMLYCASTLCTPGGGGPPHTPHHCFLDVLPSTRAARLKAAAAAVLSGTQTRCAPQPPFVLSPHTHIYYYIRRRRSYKGIVDVFRRPDAVCY